MSFHLYRSNRLETLAGLFQKHLYECDSDVFTPVTAVVANTGMGAFLQRYLAEHAPLAANLQCGFLRDFLTQSICAFLTEAEQELWRKSQESFSPAILSWRINALFTEKPEDFPQWRAYFQNGSPSEREKRRFELAARLAKLFDDYSLYCHEKLIAWRQGETARHPFDGQQKLYRTLTETSVIPGREVFFDRIFRAEKPLFPERLPKRAGVFGIDCMPDLYLKILVKLSNFCDIHLFSPAPSKEFMEVDKRTRREKIEDAVNGKAPEIHPLLSDLGSAGAAFLDSLLDNDCVTGLAGAEEESFREVLTDSLFPNRLQQFQSDLLNQFYRRGEDKCEYPAEDDSIQLHSCHTIRRELEVLHDKLTGLFKTGSYTPDDVIVMFPDINRYAPVIEAVFGNGPFEGKFSVCDRTQLDASPAAVCFLRLLKLCDSRFTAPEIMELLEFPFLLSAFQLNYSDLPELEEIVLQSDIRWGFDAGLHDRFCKVNFPEFTFQDGFDRQLEFFAHGETGFARAALLGRFIEAVRAFEELRKKLLQLRTPEEWSDFLQHELLERFFDCKNPEYSDELLELRRRIIDFGIAAHKGQYTHPLHIAAVTAALDFSGAIGKQNFLRGKMTFCSLVPLRSVPAKIIAVLGLNSEDFPPPDSRDELNLLIQAHMPGTPSSSADARYLLLETLMAAREKLILSYLGESPEKAEKLEPAPPLGSIIEILKQGYECKVTQFPLQSVALEENLAKKSREIVSVSPDSVEPEKLEKLNLRELCDILLNPVSAWWRAHWKEEMEMPEERSAEADEPLSSNTLLNSILCRRLFELEQQNLDADECKAQLAAERLLPLGGIGSECFETIQQQLAVVPEKLKTELAPETRRSRTLEFPGKTCTLSDSGLFYDAGAIELRFSQPNIEKIFPLYLEQLLRCACGEACERKQYFVIKGKDDYEINAVQAPSFTPAEAQTRLNELLELAQRARQEQLPLFCHASSAYAQTLRSGNPAESAWSAAEKAFSEDTQNTAVASVCNSWAQAAGRKTEFEALALQLYAPLFPGMPPKPEKEQKKKKEKNGFSVSDNPVPAGAEDENAAPWKLVPLKGYAVLEAAAGTGKTHNLKNIVARLVTGRPEIEIGNIVVVTFTRAAAGELRGRIRERLEALAQQTPGDEEIPELVELSGVDAREVSRRAHKALLAFDNAPIGTIHSFAARVLRDHGFGSRMRFNFSVAENDSEALSLCLNDFYRRMRYSDLLPQKLQQMIFDSLSLGKLGQIVNFYRANPECIPESFPSIEPLPPESEWETKLADLEQAVIGEAFAWCRQRMVEHNEKENVLSNDDLIFELQKALREQPGLKEELQREYPVGLIDEFQDTDRKQFEIFRTLFIDNPQGTLIVVGDPRQAIYRFRGGDIDTYFSACKELQAKGANVFQMNCNRRSTPALIQGFNAIFANNPIAFAREGMTLPVQTPANSAAAGLLDEQGNPVKGALDVLRISGNADAGIVCCAEKIAAMLNAKLYLPPDKNHAEKIPLAPDHIAVLVTTWPRARAMREALKKFNIPAVCIKGENVFSSQEANILRNLLEAAANPESPSTRFRACSALGSIDGKMVDITPELCIRLRDLWLNSSFIAMFNALTEQMFIIERFSALSGGERRIANWYQLGDLLYESCSKNRLTPRAAINELNRQITAQSTEERFRAIRETDRGAVVIDTVFGSKGLAYPVVFLPELFDTGRSLYSNMLSGKYHDNNGILHYNPDGDADIQERERREITQENLRKFYVALTRARYYCCFVFGEVSSKRSATDWLFRRPAEKKYALMQSPPETPLFVTHDTPDPEFPEILTHPLALPALPENFRLALPPVRWRQTDHETKIAGGRTFLSFSGLVQHEADQLAAKFRSDHFDEEIAALPGGTIFGLAIHRILELTAFDTGAEKLGLLTRHVMESYGFFDSKVQHDAAVMLGNVLQTPVEGTDGIFRLADIPSANRKAEFEFLYRTESRFSRTAVLKRAFNYFDAKFPTAEHGGSGGDIHFDGAFFNGFIDLFFEHQGKFYIVDWKTNMLGSLYEEYSFENTAAAMRSNGYCLQYLIYTAALMKYLAYRLKKPLDEILYEDVFGGIRYFFTRGCSPEHPGCGIFSDRPAWRDLKPFLELIG